MVVLNDPSVSMLVFILTGLLSGMSLVYYIKGYVNPGVGRVLLVISFLILVAGSAFLIKYDSVGVSVYKSSDGFVVPFMGVTSTGTFGNDGYHGVTYWVFGMSDSIYSIDSNSEVHSIPFNADRVSVNGETYWFTSTIVYGFDRLAINYSGDLKSFTIDGQVFTGPVVVYTKSDANIVYVVILFVMWFLIPLALKDKE